MKKLTLFFASLLCVTCIAVAQLKLYVYQNDGTRTEFVASTVDSIAFSIITDAPNQPDDPVKPEETIETKLYFVNKKGWIDVRAYIWSAEEGVYIAWPGEYVYKENYNINGHEVYSYDMSDKQLYDMIIFNGLATSTSFFYSQTSDLEIDYSKPYYYNEDWYASTDEIPDYNGHEYVDLGLPSGILWATCNVGANSPEDYGDYFAWGETEPKDYYYWDTYKWMTEGMSSWFGVNKYTFADGNTSGVWYNSNGEFIGDNKTILELSDDAAHANWGVDWRMPTKAEQDELCTECTWDWTTQNGVNGYKVTSKTNGNSIFLPAAGYRYDSDLDDAGYYGGYMSSSLSTYGLYYAYYLYFDSDGVGWSNSLRGYGHSVRPVMP